MNNKEFAIAMKVATTREDFDKLASEVTGETFKRGSYRVMFEQELKDAVTKITCGAVSGENLEVTEEMLIASGFTKHKARRSKRCFYFTHSLCKYAVVYIYSADYKWVNKVIIPAWLLEALNYRSICFKNRKDYRRSPSDEETPVVTSDDGDTVYLHKFMLEIATGRGLGSELKYDHINGSRLCCIEENLRIASDVQNSGNMARTLQCATKEIKKINFSVTSLDAGQEQELKDMGLKVKRSANSKGALVSSKVYTNKDEWFTDMKKAQRIIYGDFLYDILNDFCKYSNCYGVDLLIHRYILGDMTEEEIRLFNFIYQRSRLCDEPDKFDYAMTNPLEVPYSLPKIA